MRPAIVMVVGVKARQVAGPSLMACARHVAAGRVELAPIPLALVFAGGDSFWPRAVVLVIARVALCHRERRDDHQPDGYRKTHRLQHGRPLGASARLTT
jgi:hypothetical protein